MRKDAPFIRAHQEWLGFVRPTGLVVSAHAMVRAGAVLDAKNTQWQKLLLQCVEERTFEADEGPAPYVPDFVSFARTVLGWSFSPKGYAGLGTRQDGKEVPIPPQLEVHLPEYGETLRPDIAVRELGGPGHAASLGKRIC